MEQPTPAPQSVVPVALVVEGGMGLLALVLGWLLSYPPGDAVQWDLAAAGWGVVGAIPLLGVMALCLWVPWKPLADLLRVIDEMVVPLFRPCRLVDLALIAALAGLGEEMLFRGVIQRAVAGQAPTELRNWIGAIAAGLMFGMAHSLTRAYAVLAAAIGVYLGWLLFQTDNLLVPIVAHAVYDFLALVYLVRIRGARQPEQPEE